MPGLPDSSKCPYDFCMASYPSSSIAFVTGATGGIGQAITARLIAMGHRVIGTGRRKAALDELADRYGENFRALVLDLGEADIASVIEESLPDDWRDIGILVNNAGHDHGGRRPFADMSQANIDDILAINLRAAMAVTHALIPGMLRRGSGHIINIGSVAGLRPYAGGTAYSAAKHGLSAFTEALRADYRDTDLRIGEIQPGATRTGFAAARHGGDQARGEAFYAEQPGLLEGEDIAESVAFMLSLPPHANAARILILPTRERG